MFGSLKRHLKLHNQPPQTTLIPCCLQNSSGSRPRRICIQLLKAQHLRQMHLHLVKTTISKKSLDLRHGAIPPMASPTQWKNQGVPWRQSPPHQRFLPIFSSSALLSHFPGRSILEYESAYGKLYLLDKRLEPSAKKHNGMLFGSQYTDVFLFAWQFP